MRLHCANVLLDCDGMTSVEPDTPVEVADVLGRSILVLYGSETGNSQDIAEELGRMLKRLHFKTVLDEMDAVKLVSFMPSSPIFLHPSVLCLKPI